MDLLVAVNVMHRKRKLSTKSKIHSFSGVKIMMIDKRLINSVPEAKKFVFLTVLAQIFTLISNTTFIFCAGFILRAIRQDYCILSYLLIMVLCILISACMNFIASFTSFRASKKVKITLRTHIYEKILQLGAGYQEHSTTAKIVQLATEGVEQLETWFSSFLPQFYYSMIASVATFCFIAFLNLQMALVLLGCIPLIPISMVIVQGIARRLLKNYWGQYANLADNFLENLQGLTTLQIYKADEFKAKQMAGEAENFRRVTMKVLSMQLNSIIIMDVIAYGGAALGIVLALSSYWAGNIPLENTFICILLSADFFIPLRRLGSAFHTAMNGSTASKNIFELLDLGSGVTPAAQGSGVPPLIGVPLKTTVHRDCRLGTSTKRGCEIYRTFANSHSSARRYASSLRNAFGGAPCPNAESTNNVFYTNNLSYTFDRTVLSDCNITIKQGEITAFVGKSGSGKSTVAKVLAGIYRNYTGSVCINGTEFREINAASLHNYVSYISHRDWIFAGTVRDCLLEGNSSTNDEQMNEVLSQVQLLDFVNENGGLSMELREGGENLSGGQKQRLSIARALLHGSEVLIFDEATSNIDIESEAAILELIRSLKGKKTVIIISHRKENCAFADQTYFFEEGRVQGAPTQEAAK